MGKALRWAGYAVGGLVALILVAAAYLWIASNQKLSARVTPRPERLVTPTPAALADAARRARTLGCVSCHGEGLRGKIFMDNAKVATIHAPNLTEVASRATDEQLAQAIRQGVGVDGRSLVVMPSEAYQYLTDEETSALIAYLRSLPRGGGRTPPVKVGPLGRVGLVNGKLSTIPHVIADYRKRPTPDFGPGHALGRHLARTTCAGCHGSDLGGRQISPEFLAPDLVIAGAYDLPAFTRLLREGVAPGNKPLKMMRGVAKDDARYYKDEEIAALHAYLVERAQRAP